jgi:hypothetical protein
MNSIKLSAEDDEKDKNKILYFNKVYSVYKKIVEDYISAFPEFSNVFKKIVDDFSEIVYGLINEAKMYKEKSDNSEILFSSKFPILI